MSRAIDADALEKEGWSLHRTIRVDKNTDEYQIKPLKQVPTIELDTDTVSRRQAIDALFEILDRPKHAEFLYADEIARALNQLPPSLRRPHDISKAKFSCPICGAEMEVTVDEWDEGSAV